MNLHLTILGILFLVNLFGTSIGLHSTVGDSLKSWILQVISFYLGYHVYKINGKHYDEHEGDIII